MAARRRAATVAARRALLGKRMWQDGVGGGAWDLLGKSAPRRGVWGAREAPRVRASQLGHPPPRCGSGSGPGTGQH